MGSKTDVDGTIIYPSLAWVYAKPWRVIAFSLGTGVLRPGPGTWGTVFGWLVWALLLTHLSDLAVGAVLVVSYIVGCWACQRTGQDLGVSDHGGMNWDEAVAFWFVLWLSPDTWLAQTAAFLLFRFFDIVKPPPIRYFDQRFDNGFGVMWDDIVAAAYALLGMAVLVRLGVLT